MPRGLKSGLARRLLSERQDIDSYLELGENPPSSMLGFAGLDMANGWQQLQALLTELIDNKVPTLVYGDYDVDGVTSSFLMYRFLKLCNVPGNCFIPSRFRHGYGLDASVVAKATEQGYGALLALDCGTANLAEVKQAVTAGLKVGIIDHHQPKDDVPDVPLLNPSLEPGAAPLCTAGLVYSVIERLCESYGQLLGDELELAGLATIADVVPLVPANWYLATEALKLLPGTTNHGLQELIKVSGLHGLTRFTGQQAAFNLIPRLNAPGRMRSARKGLDLLFADSPQLARGIAAEIDQLNRERRSVADAVSRQAALDASGFERLNALALSRPDWHPGVLGLAAARVAELFGKPTAILAQDPANTGMLSGSARTAMGYDVLAALKDSPALQSCGGHRQAAGLKLKAEDMDAFREQFSAAVGTQHEVEIPEDAAEHVAVSLAEFTAELEEDLWALAPFGPAHQLPPLRLEPCRITRLNLMGRDKTHVSLTVSDGVREMRLVGFNQSHVASRHSEGDTVAPVVEIDVDNYNNKCTIQVRLIGLDEDHATRTSTSR